MSKTETRSQKQINAYFLFQEWIADEMIAQGISLKQLVMEVEMKPTKNNLHEVFKAILDAKFQKTSTTVMTREEMSKCLDDYMDTLYKVWVNLYFPDSSKEHLLQFYN